MGREAYPKLLSIKSVTSQSKRVNIRYNQLKEIEMYIPVNERGEEEFLEDLMDLIDPDAEYAVEALNLGGRLLSVAMARSNYVTTEADYERALVRSAELAVGEWIV